jgi:DNA-binding Xre family transcriptional regulator
MLKFNLKPIFAARGIERPYSLLLKAGFTKNVAHKLLNDEFATMRLRQLDKVCTILNCTPNDLIFWTPNNNETISKNHPLRSLKEHEVDLDWQDTIKTVPLNQLKQIISIIKNHKPTIVKTPIPKGKSGVRSKRKKTFAKTN